MQIRARVRNGHVYEEKMSGMSTEEMPSRGYETRVRGAREPVLSKEEREEIAERQRQAAGQHHHSRRPHARYHEVRPAPARGGQDCKFLC